MSSVDPVSLAVMGLSTMSSMQQQKHAQKNAARQAQAQQARQIEQQRIAERKRKEALKIAVAKRRARFGAGGLSSSGGSARAILAGLARQSAQGAADAKRLNSIERSAGPSLFDDKFGLAANLLDEANTRFGIDDLFKAKSGD